jgi:hypothetical protein
LPGKVCARNAVGIFAQRGKNFCVRGHQKINAKAQRPEDASFSNLFALQSPGIIMRREDFGLRWQSAAATPLLERRPTL